MKNPEYTLPRAIRDGVRARYENTKDYLYEALLWRGFLAGYNEQGQLGLYRGSDPEDFATLRKAGCVVEMLEEGEFAAKISASDWLSNSIAEKIMNLYPKNHMTGKLLLGDEEKSFFACGFGEKRPVVTLDPGIALMVKALPVCALRTVMSCHGHRSKAESLWPVLHFHGKHDLEWAVIIFEELAKCLPEFSRLEWCKTDIESVGWLRYKMVFCPRDLPGEDELAVSYENCLLNLQMAARQLMQPEIYERIRRAKGAAMQVSELRVSLQRELSTLPPKQER